MQNYLSKNLRQNVVITEASEIFQRLPLAFKGRYHIYHVTTNGISWLAIEPKQADGLVTLRRDRNKIESLEKLNCAIFLESASFYMKEKMMDEGIPFVIRGKQIYLPFIGMLMSKADNRELKPVYHISFLTQKILLLAIYKNWQDMKVSDIASFIGKSKMSISRCFDELEYLNVDVLSMKGKSRVISMPLNRKKLWDKLLPILRNPVIHKYILCEDVKLPYKAGMSALSEYSLFSDNEYPTYLVTKKEITSCGVKDVVPSREGDDVGSIVLELGYFIDFNNMHLQDPLSVALSLQGTGIDDERIDISIKEMLEEYVWSRE